MQTGDTPAVCPRMTIWERWKHEDPSCDTATGRRLLFRAERKGRGMSPQDAPRCTLEDIARLERVPLARRLAVSSTYALLHKSVASSPEQPAHCFLPLGDPPQPGEALTARAFLGKVHQ